MRAELERADLNARPRKLAMWSIKVTLLAGRVSVVIPNRARVGHVLKILPQHFGAIAEELGSAGILTLKDVGEGWELIVYPDARLWNVGWTWDRAAMDGLLSEIAAAPGQVQGELLESEPCLAKALAEVGAERAACVGYQKGNLEVPEKGTRPSSLRSFKAESFSKPSKLKGRDAREVERLKGALLDIEGGPESAAVAGMRLILSEPVFENDGGKWRNRWRADRARTHEVFAAMVEEMAREKAIVRPGGFAQWLWDGSQR